MLKKILTSAVLIMLASTELIHSAENPFPLPPSAISASYSEGSFSSMLNPVFCDLETAEDIAFRYLSYDGIEGADLFTSVNLFGFNLIFANYKALPVNCPDNGLDHSVNLYSLNKGFFLMNTFGAGLGYSFSRSKDNFYDGFRAWNLGLLFRPNRFLSFGAAFRDLNGKMGGEKIQRSDIYSVAIRPWKEYFTITADCIRNRNSGTDFYYSAELKTYKDISFLLKYGTDKSITAALTLPLYIRSGQGMELILDGYGSGRSDTADLRSAGAAIKFSRRKKTMQIAAADNFICIKIKGNYTTERDESGPFAENRPLFQDLARGIERAGEDPTIKGFIVEIDNSGFGMAQLQEIRDLLNRARSNGKEVYAVLNYSGNKEYYLATASDRIFFTPNSTFSITGLTLKTYFIKGLLDMGGVKFESISKGRYKSFNETFTRTGMSNEARENLTAILSDLNEQFITGIIEERKISRSDIDELFSRGSYTPELAKEKRFIDEIMYYNEAVDSLKKKILQIPFEDYLKENNTVTAWGNLPSIAVINVTGSIVSGKSSGGAASGSTGDYSYKQFIDISFGNPNIKAVVIRIDSGGGSAAASDFMWNALVSAKKKNPKPVVFSFGNTAASGGYYIASTGDPVFASKGTITGSIGVVAGKISAEELYSKLGISTETIKMSEFADMFSESRSLTNNEKKLLQHEINFIYDRFTGKVIEGRKISKEELDQIAEGRIHTGAAAKEKKLINETGGITAAIEFARTSAGIDTDFRLLNLPHDNSFFKGALSGNNAVLNLEYFRFIASNIEKYRLLDEKALYLQPYTVEIK